ncbi:MAG: hypothetical protein ABW202_23630 [Duganella sp.]
MPWSGAVEKIGVYGALTEGLHVTDDQAERAGRMIAGEVSYVQIVEELRHQHG